MPATLYLRSNPRAFFLITETHALVFRQPHASESKAARSVVVAEFVSLDEVDMRGLVRVSKSRPIEGVLGVTSVPSDRSPIPEIFLLLVSSSSTLSPLSPSSSLRPARVIGVEFHSLSSSFWDPPELSTPSYGSYADDQDDPYYTSSFQASSSSSSSVQSQASAQGVEHPCLGMKKYLESGGFFYAQDTKWDISTRMGETNWLQAEKGQSAHPLETFDERFVWNASLLAPFIAFRNGLPLEQREKLDEQALLIPMIQGFVGSAPIPTGEWTEEGKPGIAALGLISRLSWKRAGARFRTRGIDDDGQVANFVETEVILATEAVTFSWAVVRGSVPLFWQQPSQGLGTLQQKVEITRPPQASQPAFDKHFMELMDHYHSVHAINLLGQKDAEAMLSASYSDHLQSLRSSLDQTTDKEGTVDLTPYDFHATVRTHGHEGVRYDMSTRLREVIVSRRRFGWTACDSLSGQIVEQQQGVFRVNCLDCLDRTNYVQDVMSSLTLTAFLESIGSSLQASNALWMAHRELWADNGDRLSKIYAGTGALNTSATRSGKKTFAGLLSDATKSVGRAYINNFQDKGKQAAIDMLLGMMAGQRPVILFDPIGDSVQSAMSARIKEYSRSRSISMFAGTWNLNGKAPDESLDPWLFPHGHVEADVYMIAFQEIVELTAGQILQTDPAKRRMWEKYIMDTFDMRLGKKSEYILYRSEQLVGTALIVVVKSSIASAMRHVESATKKTGLQGLSGNKGGVGIRFNLYDSTACLMTCHLAAGHSNVGERNADYKTIEGGLKFLRGKSIEDHDIIIWAADFNYRISLPNDDVRSCAETDQIDQLLGADQLLQAMDEGEVFNGYKEGPITFRPTYKYDNGTDEYDTSDKARIPAWTDRILYKGQLKLAEYSRAELRTSDHRPVYAVFEAKVREVDQGRKERVMKEVMERLKAGEGLDGLEEKGVRDLLDDRENEVSKSSNTRTPRPPISPASSKPPVRTDQFGTASGQTNSTRRPPAPPPSRGSGLKSPAPTSDRSNRPIPSSEIPKLPPRPTSNTAKGDDKIPDGLVTPLLPTRPIPKTAQVGIDSASNTVRPPQLPVRKGTQDSTISTETPRPTKGSVLSAISAFESAARSNVPSSSTSAVTSQRKPAPPVTPQTQKKIPEPESPIITPASTGDYMIVTTPSSVPTHSKPPPLPDRQRKSTLDLDGSPPKNLVPPDKPDQALSPSSEKPSKRPPPVVAKPKDLRSTSVSSSVTGLD